MDFWLRGAFFRAAAALVVLLIAQSPVAAATKGELPIPAATLALMAARDTSPSAPVLIRSYKKESEIEVWKQAKSGRFVLLKTFPICRWSGALGPKTKQGDRQTPEGFYSVGPKQMNPYSHYYLSFDTGYPNAYDRAHGYTGSDVMVHGICSSAGCFAMTDKGIGEIFAIAREALKGGQPAFQFQAFPFRMTAQNMAKYRSDPNIEFWRQLKEGSDRFEATGEELVVNVTAGRYAFAPSQDPSNEALASAHRLQEKARIAALIAEGSAAVRTVYADGGQNAIFAALLSKGAHLGEVSRPEALAFAGVEEVITPARGRCARPGGCPSLIAKAAVPTQAKPAEDKPPQIILAAAHVSEIPETDPAALAPTPFCYKLGRPAPVQSVIAGAMPMLPAILND
ncbi:MAG: murein L,D-transpeptidase family protein [Methylocella sp.]